MFSLQHGFFEQTIDCDRNQFEAIVNDKALNGKIGRIRELKAAGNEKEAQRLKRTLPAFIFQATFKESTSKNGYVGKWRKNATAVLSGLFVMDVDHLEEPFETFHKFNEHVFMESSRQPIALVYITPSGHGLKIVAQADPSLGNLIENQRALATRLGVKIDEQCKDAARMSFVCTLPDILYRNDTILFGGDLTNQSEYDKAFGEYYRNPTPAQLRKRATDRAARRAKNRETAGDLFNQQPAETNNKDAAASQPVAETAAEPLMYGTASVKSIVDEYIKREGNPVEGDRHRHLLQMAGRLRYIVDNSPEKLKKAVREADYVRKWESEEANTGEIDDICEDVCTQKVWYNRPKSIEDILRRLGVSSSDESGGESAVLHVDQSVYEEQWNRLKPLLGAPYDVCTEGLSDNNKLAAVYAAGTMFCTLLTRCWYRHYDGQKQRMNPQTYIIGEPASGKSFAYRLDREIMAVMRAADEPGRKAEADYKAQRKEKADAKIKMPQPVIRYIPSRTSNAVFYRRALNSKEIIDGVVEHLHLYTFDSELDSSVTAQSGGSWIGKHDIELKAFHNEFSGVDYANSDSVNENIQVFYNTVISGTNISLSKKVTMANVNDGLCSRMAIFRMQSSDYKMIEKGNFKRNHDTELKMKEWGYFFDRLKGELKIDRLVDYVYELCKDAAVEAEIKDDKVLDYLRKRAVFYATWFTVPRILARLRNPKEQKVDTDISHIEVTDEDLEFAKLIFDTVVFWQDQFFGQMLTDAWRNGEGNFKPRNATQYLTRNRQKFDALNSTFSLKDAERTLGISNSAARSQLRRWEQEGWIERKDKNYVKR